MNRNMRVELYLVIKVNQENETTNKTKLFDPYIICVENKGGAAFGRESKGNPYS